MAKPQHRELNDEIPRPAADIQDRGIRRRTGVPQKRDERRLAMNDARLDVPPSLDLIRERLLFAGAVLPLSDRRAFHHDALPGASTLVSACTIPSAASSIPQPAIRSAERSPIARLRPRSPTRVASAAVR